MSGEELVHRIRERFPAQLRELPVWLLWKLAKDDSRDKPKKVPYYADGNARSGTLDGPEDRQRLVTFEQAAAAFLARGYMSGLGIALGVVPGKNICLGGIDLDGCCAATGEPDERASEIMRAAHSYTERSPSGLGIHVLGTGDVGKTKISGLEIYGGARYFTVTGERLNGADLNCLEEAARVARNLFGVDKPVKAAAANGAQQPIPNHTRNNSLASEAGKLRRLGLSPAAIAAALQVINTERCQPPLPAHEVEAIARSIGRYAAGMEWPEPVDILQDLAAPPLTGEELPPVLAAFPLAYAQATGFDPSITLGAALAVSAAALSDDFKIVGNSDTEWFQKPLLWVLTIARPGAGKTPAQRAMLHQLWEIQRALREQYEKEIQELKRRKNSRGADGLKEEEDEPPRPRIILGDTTIEALSEALRDNPRGILIANDEFESWLGSLDAYRRGAVSRDRGEWLRLFDGGGHAVERIQRGSVFVPNWSASILTATTPAALAKLSRSLPEDGLLQRFIPIIGSTKREPRPVEGLDEVRKAFHQTVQRLFDARPRAHKGCVPLSLPARDFLREWERRHQLRQEAFGSVEPGLEAHLAKYPNFLLRITLTLHAANVVNHEHELARDPAGFAVPLATIECAARFLKRISLHALALYVNRSSGSEAYTIAREVARAMLARGWDQVARRNLIHGVRAFRNATSELQDSTLRLLADMGWLREAEGGYSKPTPARYDINPKLQPMFAQVAARERERRAIIREAIAEAVDQRRQDRTQ
jgi:hypothetical protein